MDSNQKKWVIIGTVVVGVLGLAFILYLNVRPEPPIPGVIQFPRPSRGHDNNTQFPLAQFPVPPAGGVHWDRWQNCGVYETPVETGYAVHSLEHGAVWITYHPDLSAADVARLRTYVEGQSHMLLSPYPDQPSPVVLTAWGVQMQLDGVDDGRITRFINRYLQGPFTPEPGAACSQSVGNPIDRAAQTGGQSMP